MFKLFKRHTNPIALGEFSTKDFSITLPFAFEAGLLIVDVEIEDTHYKFLFDTGAFTLLSKELSQKLTSKKYEEKLHTLDASGVYKELALFTLPSLKLGDLSFNEYAFAVDDFMHSFPFSCLKIDGVLGYNFLQKLCVSIDYENALIRLSDTLPETEEFTKVKLKKSKNNLLEFRLQVAKKSFHLGLDTGKNDGLMIGDAKMAAYFSTLNFAHVRTAGTFSSSMSGTNQHSFTESYLLKNISIEKKVAIDSFVCSYEKEALNIAGNEFLKEFHLIIDFRRKNLYLKKRDAKIEKKHNSSYGFTLFWSEEKKLHIAAIRQDSPAYHSKLKIGDQLLSIGETDTLAFTQEEYCRYIFLADKQFYGSQERVELIVKREGRLLRLEI